MTDERHRQTRESKQEEKMGTKGLLRSNRVSASSPWARALAMAVVVAAFTPSSVVAQYNSGSSGVHGVFPPAPVPAGTTYLLWHLKTGLVRYCSVYDEVGRPDLCTTEISTAQIPGIPAGGLTTGVFEFSNFDASAARAGLPLAIYPVGYEGPTPLTILSQGSFRLRNDVSLNLEGAPGLGSRTGLPPTGLGEPGGRPGPGGFAGGSGGKMGTPSTNGSPGFGPTGGAGGFANGVGGSASGSDATPTTVATSLVPLIGGSGGGGGGAYDTLCGFRGAGAGGGGGGGAVLIAAGSEIRLDPQMFIGNSSGIRSHGGIGAGGCGGISGAGSGGSVRLVAPTITGLGPVLVGNGIVRFEGSTSTFGGTVDAIRGTVLATPQAASPSGFPVLRITSVGGIAVGPTPSGGLRTPDVTFPTAPIGPVAVQLAASNVPVGTVVNLRANPATGDSTTASSSSLTGTAASSTASASLQIPPGVGVITAITSFPVTTALLERLPFVPGLTPTAIEVTADAGGTSRVFMIGAEARRVEVTMGADGRFAVVQ